jgi:hypothetical protein
MLGLIRLSTCNTNVFVCHWVGISNLNILQFLFCIMLAMQQPLHLQSCRRFALPLFPEPMHLNDIRSLSILLRELALLSHLRLCDPDPQKDQILDRDEDDTSRHQYPDNHTRYLSLAVLLLIEEGIHIVVLRCVRQVCQTEVQGEDDDDSDHVQPWERKGTREDDLNEGIEGVEGVLGEVGPEREGSREAGIEEGPEDDCEIYC